MPIAAAIQCWARRRLAPATLQEFLAAG